MESRLLKDTKNYINRNKYDSVFGLYVTEERIKFTFKIFIFPFEQKSTFILFLIENFLKISRERF